MQKSPLFFIKKMWGIEPERDNKKFVKGKHISWQQHDILLAVEEAINGGKNRISVASGHGVGKSTALSWLILWFLFCYKDAQIPCTAPTSEQMHDILWKELALWLGRMPEPIQGLYELTAGYLRVKERSDTWFARAKTARKESPEALAGVHGDWVMFIIDEASGVPDEIFRTAEGALTGDKVLVIMISNPTRLLGYFYDSHHSDSANWQIFSLNSEESPLVNPKFVKRIADQHGVDSDEYRIRVQGLFPKEDSIDDQGYVPLLVETDLKEASVKELIGGKRMGVDPSGEGDDETVWAARDNFKARLEAVEKISTPKTIAAKTLTLIEQEQIDGKDTTIDNFGDGANVPQEIALAEGPTKKIRVNGVNVGDPAIENERFLNLRAEAYWRLREWVKKGGEFVDLAKWKVELLSIRYRRTGTGSKIQIMDKRTMKKLGFKSPNKVDALMLTFCEPETKKNTYKQTDWEESTNYGV